MQDPLHNDSEPTHVFSTSSPLSCNCLKDRSWHHTTAKDSGLIFLVFLILFVSAPLHSIWDVSERLPVHTHLAVSQPRELFSHEWNAGAQSSFKQCSSMASLMDWIMFLFNKITCGTAQHFEDFWSITLKKQNNNTKSIRLKETSLTEQHLHHALHLLWCFLQGLIFHKAGQRSSCVARWFYLRF